MEKKICALTGLRPHKMPFQEGSEEFRQFMRYAEATLRLLINDNYRIFVTGCAMGSDIWLGEAVLRLKRQHPHLELHCVIPFEEQASKWTEEWRNRYFAMCRQNDHEEYVSRKYTPTCYLERNRSMVDRASLVLAVYDGRTNGGTAYTIRYARTNGTRVLILDPTLNHIDFTVE